MQTTKFLFVIGTVAVLAAPLAVTAGPDNEAQAKMREALRQKMAELNAQSTPAPAPTPVAPTPVVEPVEPTPPPTPTPAPVPEPAVKAPTVVVPVPAETPEPAAVAPVTDEASAERAREALRKKMEALNTQTAPAVAPVTPPPRPVVPAESVVSQPPTAPVAPVAAPKSDGKFSEVTDSSEEAKAARLREVLRQKMATAPQPAPAPTATATVRATPATPAKPATTMAAPTFSAPAAPALASPFSGSKQERLAELLRRYRADAITPQEYHTQRAKIIAEP